jgi:hypothetical protein
MMRLANVTRDGSELIVVTGDHSPAVWAWYLSDLSWCGSFGGDAPHGADRMCDFSAAKDSGFHKTGRKLIRDAEDELDVGFASILHLRLCVDANRDGVIRTGNARDLAEAYHLPERWVARQLTVLHEAEWIEWVKPTNQRHGYEGSIRILRSMEWTRSAPVDNPASEAEPDVSLTGASRVPPAQSGGAPRGNAPYTEDRRLNTSSSPRDSSVGDASGFIAEVRAALRDPSRWAALTPDAARIVRAMGGSSSVRQIEDRRLDYRLREAWQNDQLARFRPAVEGRREEAT